MDNQGKLGDVNSGNFHARNKCPSMTTPTTNNLWYTNDGQPAFADTMSQHAGHSNNQGSWQQVQQPYNWYTPQTNADHQMNRGNSWNWNGNQQSSHQYVGQQYQSLPHQHQHQQQQQLQQPQQQQQQQHQHQHQPVMNNFRNPTQNSDPWNWGWDDSGNTEQVNNNNTATDPRWNWGVENTYQDGQHGYGQHGQHQSWSTPSQQDTSLEYRNATGHVQEMHNQHPVPNSTAIADSFNLTSHSENTLFQRTPSMVKTEVVKSDVSYSEHFSPASTFFNQDSFNQSQSSQHNYTQSQGSLSSFNQSQSSVVTSQSQTDINSLTDSPDEKVSKPIENASVDDKKTKTVDNSVNENIPSGASSIFSSVRNDSTEFSNESFGVSDLKSRKDDKDLSDAPNDVPYQSELRLDNSSVEQDTSKNDRLSSQWSTESLASQEVNKSNSSTGNNGLSSQWSTESLPSQASDDHSHTVDGSNQNEHPSVTPVSQGEMLQNHHNQGDQYDQYLHMYHTSSNDVLQSSRTISVAPSIDNSAMLQETLNIGFEEVQTESVSVTSTAASSQPPPSAGAGAEALVLENNNLKIGEVENEEIIYPEDKNLGLKGKSSFNVPKYKAPSPTLEGASGLTERKNFGQVGITSSVVSELGTQFTGLSLQSGYVSNNVESLDGMKRLPSTHRTEDGVNMETVPDNEERPDVVDLHPSPPVERQGVSTGLRNDMFCPVGQDAEREPGSQWILQSNYSASPENQEVAPRPDRNQYLETGQLTEDADTRSCIPEGLHRMIPGQITEQTASTSARVPTQMLDAAHSSISLNNSVSPPRMVPGQLNRMVPGQLNESSLGQDLDANLTLETSVDDDLSHRMVPGQLTEESDSNVNIGTATARSTADDIPPPGLRRMIPGESSSPESQGNSTVMLQQSANTFQPLPLEPRVVTGVAQDEMDTGSSVTVLQQPSSPSPGSRINETESPLPDQTSNSLPQPPSERSETIGSDGVDSFQPVTSDVNTVRETSSTRRENVSKDRDHRHRDDESEDGSQRRAESPSRYRDWNYDSRDRYRMHDSQRSRQNSSYERRDEDADTEDYYSDHDREKRYREYGGRYKGRDDRERRDREIDKGPRQGHHRSSRREHEHDREPDLGRNRNSNRDRKRSEYDRHERHHDRHDYHHPEEYYNRSYDEEYYRDSQRSRPSSRSEYEDYRRRDYNYGGYSNYYGRQMDPYYDPYYTYKYYENLRRTNPAAYAAWYAKYYGMPQNYNQDTSYSGERGSVHSGRSSANEELNKERYQRTGHYNSDYYNSTITGEYEIGRGAGRTDSLLEETTSSTPQRLSPAKFSTAHVKGILTARGQLIRICPHYPLDGQPATVEIHDVQTLLSTDAIVSELQDFPGPLVRDITHKTSVINFCQKKIKKAEKDPNLFDRESVILLWRFLVLLLKQNGTIVGTDIAELLLSNSNQNSNSLQTIPSPATSHHSIQDLQMDELSTNSSKANVEEITNKFREFLLYGNTKEALEWAMKNGLWGHALFLASKMDQRTYAQVMIRFANGLSLNDPLQTLYQMMSGRQPAAVTCCADEKWGDWKPHLAMILSNSSQRPELNRKAIMTLGDTLGARGCLHASHFCYLMANQGFGDYSQKSSKIVLIGSSHHKSFDEFATNEAIQMTEIYHYACQLADSEEVQAQFQIYKYIYALRLAELGMPSEAIHYVEVIAGTIVRIPSNFGLDFVRNVVELAEKLKLQDPIYNSAEGMGIGMQDPEWLQELRSVLICYESGQIQHSMPSYGSTSNLSYSEDSTQHGGIVSDGMKEAPTSRNEWEHHQQQQYQDQQAYYYSGQQGNWNTHSYQQSGDGSAEVSHPVDAPLDNANVTGSGGQYWGMENTNHNQENVNESENTMTDYYQKPEESKESETSGMVDYYSNSGALADSLTTGNATGQQSYNYWDMNATQGEDSTPRVTLPASSESAIKRQDSSSSQTKPSVGTKAQSKDTASKKDAKSAATNSWWIGGIWSKLALRPKNQMKLPDDKNPSIVWDPKKNRWVNVDGEEDEGSSTLAPPPKASELPKALPPAESASPAMPSAPSGTNIYKLNGPAKKPKYVNVLGGNKTSNPVIPPPSDIFPNVTNSNPGMTYFVPDPVAASENAPVDFLTPAAINDQSGKEAHLSRWSSTSSLSREVQKYTMRGHHNRTSQNSTNYGAPAMFNPADFAAASSANVGKKPTGLKRYPNN